MTTTPAERVSPLRATVAEEIRALMGRRRISGVQLAKEIGRSHTYMWRRLAGETAFDVDDLEAIARALGVRAVDLLPSTERVEPPTYRKDFGAEQPTPIWVTPHRPTDTRPPGRPRKSGPNPATRRPVRISAPPPDLRAA